MVSSLLYRKKGVSNLQLIKNNDPLAMQYNHRCICEQSSFILAWNLLMERRFEALRNAIYSDASERMLFRQLVTNSIIATDLYDTEFSMVRNERWEAVFCAGTEENIDNCNQKTTILMEYIMQSSEIAHTMEKWPIYLKWNKQLLQESYQAYKNGRVDEDPFSTWYTSQLKFLDEQALPLVTKLQQSGIFGSYVDECLEHVVRNR